jgi:nucleoid-associated protein YgaU
MADGVLLKLTILPFEDADTVQVGPPAGPPFVAQFNPESYSVNTEINFASDEPAHGQDGDEAKLASIKPRTFSFEFLLDGTGADGGINDVLAQIELFKLTVGFSGKIHRPRFLVLSWGPFLATCALESYSVNYKLFKPDGMPLRAVLSASFREHKSPTLRELISNLSSPDVEHQHQVQDGDSLWLLSHRVYKDPQHFREIARTNRLDTVRRLEPGATLRLPPLESGS